VPIKFIGNSVPILTITFFRVFISFIFLAATIPLFDKNFLKQTPKDVLVYAAIGFVLALGMLLHNSAYLFAPISNVVLFSSSSVIFAAVFAFTILKEKLTKAEIIASVLGIVGLAVMNPFASADLIGNTLAFASAPLFALAVVLMRMEDKAHTASTIFWIFLFATIFLLPLLFIGGFGQSVEKIPELLFIGIIPTGLAYLFMTFSLEKIDSDHYSIINLVVMPLAGIILAELVFMEGLSLEQIVGGALLISGGIIVRLKDKLT
jgi:drug/metabolite transporter (DMT)-like permease